MKTAIFIPSRIGSTRLPNKALADINGIPMVVHVLNRARESGITDIFVATDDEKIKKEIENVGGIAIMTESNLPSGTDRIYAAMEKISKNYDIIINLQGDMPNIKPYIIKFVQDVLLNEKNADISTAVVKITNKNEIENENIVKAVLSINNNEAIARAIYFSRSPCPASPSNQNADYYHHLGIYAYRADSLKKFVNLPISYLENREKLEQLRAIENDMKIYACIVNDLPISIDVQSDLDIIRKILI